jgi:hypothetical protein
MFIMLALCGDISYADNSALTAREIEKDFGCYDGKYEQIIKEANKIFLEERKEFFVDLAQIAVLEFFIFSLGTIAHEVGHLIAAQHLLEVRPNEPIYIDIGTITPEKTPLLFSLGNMRFYKDLPWTKGQTWCPKSVKKGSEAHENLYTGIVTIAGGVSGAAFLYSLLMLITAYCAYCDDKGLTEITLKSFNNAAHPFSYIVNTKSLSDGKKRFLLNATFVIGLYIIYNLFYGCTPYHSGDGVKIWKRNLGVTGSSLEFVHFLSSLGAWGSWALLAKNYCEARKKLSTPSLQSPLLTAVVAILSMRGRLVPKLA